MSEILEQAPVLVVPGIGDSGPLHWQSLWQIRYPAWRRITQRDWDRPSCDEWVETLYHLIQKCDVPPVVVAHSMGCLTLAHCANRYTPAVQAAFLVAIPDPSGLQFPHEALGFSPLPVRPMPWPTLIVASSNDPYGSAAFSRFCAARWGGEIVDVGPSGHLNTESGHGEWPEGIQLLRNFLKSTDGRRL